MRRVCPNTLLPAPPAPKPVRVASKPPVRRGRGRVVNEHVIKADYRVGGQVRYYLARPGERLVKVPDKVRKCVAFLAYDSPEYGVGEVCAGTAFFLGVEEAGRMFAYLVTAAHVIEGMTEKGVPEIIVRANR